MLLGLDLGTTNVKAIVTDETGRPLSRASCPVQLFRLGDGGVEQDIEEIWRATLGAIQRAVETIDRSGIRAIGVSSQGGAMQVLNAAREPRGRVISWLDQRGRRFDEALTKELGADWFLQRIVHTGSWLTVGQILRLRKQELGLVDAPNHIGFVGDIIVSRLCGRAAQDGTSAALTLLYNPVTRAYDPDLLGRLGVSAAQLPALLNPQESAGGLLHEIARITGLRAGIPVSAAVHDQYASALGTGAVEAGTVMVGTGTAWVLLAVSTELPKPVADSAFVCHHVIEGLWGQILSMVNGGSAFSWAAELTGVAGREAEGIDQLLESSPPGSAGLVFWPFMTPFGAVGLQPGSQGRLAGLQLAHGGAHVLRAVLEGLAYELNRHLRLIGRIERVVMGGGAGSSRVTPQLLADVTSLPLRCYAGSEASLLGAAIIARALLEPTRSLADLARAMVPPGKQVEPGLNAPFYRERYKQYFASLPLADQRLQ